MLSDDLLRGLERDVVGEVVVRASRYDQFKVDFVCSF